MTTPRVLPADIYDTLEFSALAFGGIGGHSYFRGSDEPNCYVGHLAASDAIPNVQVIAPFGIDELLSDRAVERINERRGLDPDSPVSWPEYTRELSIVRGE